MFFAKSYRSGHDAIAAIPHVVYRRRVIRTLIYGGLASLSLAAFPALACSPRDPPLLSTQEIIRSTKERIKYTDIIIDGIVVSDNNRTYLKPIKVWRGKIVKRYYIDNDHCGVILTHGDKVRALLEGNGSHFIMMGPLRGQRADTKLYDRIIDRHLGVTRPAGFENGSVQRLAPPIKWPR